MTYSQGIFANALSVRDIDLRGTAPRATAAAARGGPPSPPPSGGDRHPRRRRRRRPRPSGWGTNTVRQLAVGGAVRPAQHTAASGWGRAGRARSGRSRQGVPFPRARQAAAVTNLDTEGLRLEWGGVPRCRRRGHPDAAAGRRRPPPPGGPFPLSTAAASNSGARTGGAQLDAHPGRWRPVTGWPPPAPPTPTGTPDAHPGAAAAADADGSQRHRAHPHGRAAVPRSAVGGRRFGEERGVGGGCSGVGEVPATTTGPPREAGGAARGAYCAARGRRRWPERGGPVCVCIQCRLSVHATPTMCWPRRSRRRPRRAPAAARPRPARAGPAAVGAGHALRWISCCRAPVCDGRRGCRRPARGCRARQRAAGGGGHCVVRGPLSRRRPGSWPRPPPTNFPAAAARGAF